MQINQARQSFVRSYEQWCEDVVNNPFRPLGSLQGKFHVVPPIEEANSVNLPWFKIEVPENLICPLVPYEEIFEFERYPSVLKVDFDIFDVNTTRGPLRETALILAAKGGNNEDVKIDSHRVRRTIIRLVLSK